MAIPVKVFSYASGIGANTPECAAGPGAIESSRFLSGNSLSFEWAHAIHPNLTKGKLASIMECCHRLAAHTQQATAQQQRFLTLGGDHSCAIGTWSGAATALADKGPLGLIWVDAHMDSHTPESSDTQNFHGMPLATLLGRGANALTQIASPHVKVSPKHLVLIGIHDYEPSEKALLDSLKIKIFYMEDIKQHGLPSIMQQAIDHVSIGTAGFGISIDIDAVDPSDAPGTSVPSKGGLSGDVLLQSLPNIHQYPKMIGAEIAEFSPLKDQEQRTEVLICRMIQALFEQPKLMS